MNHIIFINISVNYEAKHNLVHVYVVVVHLSYIKWLFLYILYNGIEKWETACLRTYLQCQEKALQT